MRPGELWGAACDAAPDVEVAGDDRALAEAVARHRGALVRLVADPDSDVARAVGLSCDGEPRGWAVPMDALRLDAPQFEESRLAVNMVVLGTPPERIGWRTRTFALGGDHGSLQSVVVATGQFRHGLDVVPRSHPGDGWAELQLYRVPRSDRAALRRRLATGTHLPHPAITQRRIRTVTLTTPTPTPLEIDATPSGTTTSLTISVIPNAYRLLL